MEGLLPKKPRASAHIHHVDSNRPSVYTINRRYIYISVKASLGLFIFERKSFSSFPQQVELCGQNKGRAGDGSFGHDDPVSFQM